MGHRGQREISSQFTMAKFAAFTCRYVVGGLANSVQRRTVMAREAGSRDQIVVRLGIGRPGLRGQRIRMTSR